MSTQTAPAIVGPEDTGIKFSLAALAAQTIEAGCDFKLTLAEQKRPALTALNQGFQLVSYEGTKEQYFGQLKRAASKLKKVVETPAAVVAPAAEPAVEKIADVVRDFTAQTLAAHPAPAAALTENEEPLTNIAHKGPAVTAANKHSIYKVFLKRADGQLAGRASRARMKNKKLQVYLPDVMQWVRVFDGDVVFQQRFAQ